MSFDRRFKPLGQGLPGPRNFSLSDLEEGDSPVWDATQSKWIVVKTLLWEVQDSDFSPEEGSNHAVDCSAGAITATLPASPTSNRAIHFADFGSTWGTSNNLTVDGNGNNIEGASTFTADVDRGSFSAIFTGSVWIVRLI